jgi:hypothetical protein
MLPQGDRIIFDRSDIISELWIMLELPDPSSARGALQKCAAET